VIGMGFTLGLLATVLEAIARYLGAPL
jgi:hypothetical protein